MATLATEGVESEAAAGRDGPGRPWWRRPFWLVVFGLTAVSVLLSVSHIYAYRNDVQTLFLETGGTVETKLRGDGWVFHEEANNLADGLGLIDPAVYRDFGLSREVAQHPPLYLAYLTAFSHLGVRGELSHMLLTVPLGASAVAAFALLGRRVAGDTVGLLAGAYAALAPSIWPSPGFLISESLVVPLAALLALSVYRFMDRPTIGRALGMGGIAGLATLTRGELAFYVVIVIIPVVLLGIRSLDFRRRLALLVATGRWAPIWNRSTRSSCPAALANGAPRAR